MQEDINQSLKFSIYLKTPGAPLNLSESLYRNSQTICIKRVSLLNIYGNLFLSLLRIPDSLFEQSGVSPSSEAFERNLNILKDFNPFTDMNKRSNEIYKSFEKSLYIYGQRHYVLINTNSKQGEDPWEDKKDLIFKEGKSSNSSISIVLSEKTWTFITNMEFTLIGKNYIYICFFLNPNFLEYSTRLEKYVISDNVVSETYLKDIIKPFLEKFDMLQKIYNKFTIGNKEFILSNHFMRPYNYFRYHHYDPYNFLSVLVNL